MFTLSPRRSHRPGFTVCRCGDTVANNAMRELLRPGRSKGKWVCPACVKVILNL